MRRWSRCWRRRPRTTSIRTIATKCSRCGPHRFSRANHSIARPGCAAQTVSIAGIARACFRFTTPPAKSNFGTVIPPTSTTPSAPNSKLRCRKQLLERVTQGIPLPTMLEELCRLVEGLAPSCDVSILLIDPIGTKFTWAGAGPSLPHSYNGFFDGRAIDANEDPWSLAIASKAAVIAADIAKDPQWASIPAGGSG